MPRKGAKGGAKIVNTESSSVDPQKLEHLESAGNTEVSGNVQTLKRGRQKVERSALSVKTSEAKEKLSEEENKTHNDVKSKTKRTDVEIKTEETFAKEVESENSVEIKNVIENGGPKKRGRKDKVLDDVGEKVAVTNPKEVNPVKQGRKKKEIESSKVQIDQENSSNKFVDNIHCKVEEKNFEEEIHVPKKRGKKKVEECLENEDNSEQKMDPKSQNSSDFNTDENKIFEVVPMKNATKEKKLKNIPKSKHKAVEKKTDEIKSETIEPTIENEEKAPAKRGRKKIENISEKMDTAEVNLKDSTADIVELAKNSKNDSEFKEKPSTMPLVDVPSRRGRAKRKDVENLDSEKSNLKHIAKKGKNHTSPSHVHSSVKECCVVLQRSQDLAEGFQSHANKIEVKSIQQSKGEGTSKGKKGKRNKQDLNEDDKEIKPQPSKVPKKGAKAQESSNIAKTPDMKSLNFSNNSTNSKGTPWNFKISSWNVNGIRAWLEKDGLAYLHHEKPDIMSLQETKCSSDKLPNELEKIEGYHTYWLSGDKDGYSGIGLISKQKPIEVKYGIGIDEHDNEGRVITAEYETFFCVAAYVPNSGRGLVRLDYRTKWDKDFHAYLKVLDQKKPVVLCGDLNVAHEEIDLANPKTNKKSAGFTKEEREGFSALLKEGFIDTFRHLYPDEKGAYTFWTYMMNARAKNVGWRLDYFVISKWFLDYVCDCVIRKDVYGSDHCPIVLFLAV